MSKKTKRKEKVIGKKKTRLSENANSFMSKTPVWKFDRVDFNHETWNIENCDVLKEQLFKKMKSLEGQTWFEIDKKSNGKHHFIPIDNLIKSAQTRAEEIRISEYEELYSLRLTGTLRLFGILENGEYSLVWYDSGHEICPSQKKHT